MHSATSMVTTEKNKTVKNMHLQDNQVEMKEQKIEEKKNNNK